MDFKARIKAIITDNISGSSRILDNSIEAIKQYLSREYVNYHEFKELITFLLANTADFAVMHHFLTKFENKITEVIKVHGHGNSAFNNRLLEFIDEYQRKWKTPIIEAARTMSSEINFHDKKILLHSNSSSLHKVFGYLASKNIFPLIYQTLSGPANEGKDQALVLADMGFELRFIHESATGIFAKETDMMLLGADKIYHDCFINKIGSLSIALLAKYAGKPLYVLADSRKLTGNQLDPETDNYPGNTRPPEGLWEQPPEKVHPINYYFEKIPNVLVDKFFFEYGSVKGSQIYT